MRINEVVMPGLKRGTRFNNWVKTDAFDFRSFVSSPGILNIEAFTKSGEKVGYAIFSITGKNLTADKVFVDPKFRRQGIASMLYDCAEKLGNTVVPSEMLSPDSEAFWTSRSDHS